MMHDRICKKVNQMKIMPNRMDRGFYQYQEEFEKKALEVGYDFFNLHFAFFDFLRFFRKNAIFSCGQNSGVL